MASGNLPRMASIAALPGPSGFSLLLMRMVFDPSWSGRTSGPIALLGFREKLLMTAGGHEFSGRMVAAHSQPLKETATRYRHRNSSLQRQRPMVDGGKNERDNRADLTLSYKECQRKDGKT